MRRSLCVGRLRELAVHSHGDCRQSRTTHPLGCLYASTCESCISASTRNAMAALAERPQLVGFTYGRAITISGASCILRGAQEARDWGSRVHTCDARAAETLPTLASVVLYDLVLPYWGVAVAASADAKIGTSGVHLRIRYFKRSQAGQPAHHINGGSQHSSARWTFMIF